MSPDHFSCNVLPRDSDIAFRVHSFTQRSIFFTVPPQKAGCQKNLMIAFFFSSFLCIAENSLATQQFSISCRAVDPGTIDEQWGNTDFVKTAKLEREIIGIQVSRPYFVIHGYGTPALPQQKRSTVRSSTTNYPVCQCSAGECV